ncbi:MAG: YbhB/YbcL family Raf kinase inhibitor-like protein [Anaerolineales bacterium]|nr:YbhB/YbcL family Raf kinase inhibitor-like protein [Anaerolineales bacterium]
MIHLRSPSFSSGSEFPVKYTCDGEGVSPPLYWDTPPNGTQSYAIILSNPDSTSGSGWAYWVLFNIPADLRELPEAVPPEPELDDGTQHGRNSEMWLRYTGPCPPFTQRCLFRLYALDTMLDLEPGVSKEELLQAMQGHILAQGDLMTKYKRLK